MKYPKLPWLSEPNITLPHFPSRVSALIFRLWGMVSPAKIAEIIEASEAQVCDIAKRMGLDDFDGNDKAWFKKGYISILKSVWHILPYEQILQLLEWDEDRLAFCMKEDDFLSMKLGGYKPICEFVKYSEPTEDEWAEIDKIGAVIRGVIEDFGDEPKREPFDFFSGEFLRTKEKPHSVIKNGWSIVDKTGFADADLYVSDFCELFQTLWNTELKVNTDADTDCIVLEKLLGMEEEAHIIEVSERRITVKTSTQSGLLRALQYIEACDDLPLGKIERKARFKTRMIYSFCSLYANVLDEPSEVSYPDELLRRYSYLGINAVWLQGVLYQLQPYPFAPELAQGWEKRLENLRKLVQRAKRYGISVYLYMNEPRAMPLSVFEKYPELQGHQEAGNASLCTSDPRVTEYLGDAIESLCRAVPELGGFFLITMSENLTHCCSHNCWFEEAQTNCPRCINRKPLQVMADVVRTFSDAVRRAGTGAHIWAWTWGWDDFLTEENIEETFQSLPDDVTIMAVSETGIPYTIGGVSGTVSDYSRSILGPGELAKRVWNKAAEKGFEIAAKIQVNTTWECSTAPFLPVYDLVSAHLDNICNTKVSNLLLSWTLGGYPSDNLQIASQYFFESDCKKEDGYDSLLKEVYGEYAEKVKQATKLFSEAFQEFPFSCRTLYVGPQNAGPANLLFREPSGMHSAMTGFTYDDIDDWRWQYPREVFIEQLRKLTEGWKQGLGVIKDMPCNEFTDAANVGYALFRSSYNQAKYIDLRDKPQKDKKEIAAVLDEEKELAKMVYGIMQHNPSVGYEAANQYYYTKNMMLEKILNCMELMQNI